VRLRRGQAHKLPLAPEARVPRHDPAFARNDQCAHNHQKDLFREGEEEGSVRFRHSEVN